MFRFACISIIMANCKINEPLLSGVAKKTHAHLSRGSKILRRTGEGEELVHEGIIALLFMTKVSLLSCVLVYINSRFSDGSFSW